jgi:phosphodiesterase/alkaline phosphatase D-like protein
MQRVARPSGAQAGAGLIGACWLTLVALLLGWLAVARPVPVAAQAGTIAWAWSGAISHDGATVVARVQPGTSQIRLVVTPDRAGADSYTFPANGFATPDGQEMVRFRATGLESATRYRYRVETPGGARLDGRFRTWADGPFSFRLAFASCATTGSTNRVFDAIRELVPDLFVHMGDFHYLNIGRDDAGAFRRAYDRVLASPRQSALYRATPIAYIFDDHDFGADDADGSSASRPAATGVYRERVPHYPLTEGATLQQAFSIGRVRVIITDTRTARAPVGSRAPRTMLGEAQVTWLEAELTKARDAPLVIWVNTVPWITKGRESTTEGWAAYAEERTRLADHIDSLGLTPRLVMLSGDGHMAAIDDGTNSAYMSSRAKDARGFVVAHGAPLDRWTRIKGGPYSHGVSRHNHQFGLLDVADTGSALDVTVSARNEYGTVIPGLLLKLRCEKEGCTPVS